MVVAVYCGHCWRRCCCGWQGAKATNSMAPSAQRHNSSRNALGRFVNVTGIAISESSRKRAERKRKQEAKNLLVLERFLIAFFLDGEAADYIPANQDTGALSLLYRGLFAAHHRISCRRFAKSVRNYYFKGAGGRMTFREGLLLRVIRAYQLEFGSFRHVAFRYRPGKFNKWDLLGCFLQNNARRTC